MITTLVWKEYREHRVIWLATAIASSLVLVGLVPLLETSGASSHGGRADLLFAAGLFLAWGYGTICGALLLAGEVEEGTLSFLDLLPCSRRQMWWTKALTGSCLVAANVIVLASVFAALGIVGGAVEAIVSLAALAAAGTIGIGWGAFFSARGDTVMQVIARAIGGQLLFGFAALVVVLLVELCVDPIGSLRAESVALPVLLGMLLVAVVTLAGSVRRFAQTDDLRIEPAEHRGKLASWLMSWQVLLWLTWRQSWKFCVFLLAAAFLGGWAMIFGGAWVWPPVTLLVGVLCGVTAFQEEHHGGPNFAGEQRFPPGRAWFVQVTMRFVAGAGALVLLLFPWMLRAVGLPMMGAPQPPSHKLLAALFDDGLISALAEPAPFLLLWYLHGFAVGQLCRLLFSKWYVAGGVALVASAAAASIWVPSMLNCGLSLWQGLGVPLAAVAAGRIVYPAWSAGELRFRRTILILAGAAGVALLWTAGGLAYRVVEVPAPPEVDVAGYLASLPSDAENVARPRLLQAVARCTSRRQELAPAPPPGGARGGEQPFIADLPFLHQLHLVIGTGWPDDRPALDAWMQRMFDSPWVQELRAAVELPRGVLMTPGELDVPTVTQFFAAADAGVVLAGHGLWQQAHGHPEAFVEDLRTGLALSRHLQHHANRMVFGFARGLARTFHDALDRWLERLDGRADLLRQVVAELRRHELETAGDGDDTFAANFHLATKSLERPEQELQVLGRIGQAGTFRVQLAAWAWQVPWERARNHRLLGWLHGHRGRPPAIVQFPPWQGLIPEWPRYFEEDRRIDLALLRMHQVSAAFRWCQAGKSGPVPGLEVLVPDFMPVIPADPYDGRPIRFRVSPGEVVAGNDSAGRKVLPGQIILWCIGEDHEDNGGLRIGDVRSNSAVDLVYLVPLPPRR
jgi:hypothetical protein